MTDSAESPCAWEAEQVTRARAISNRTRIPTFDAAHRHPRQPVERLVDPRWEASKIVLADEPVTVNAIKRHLRSHDGVDGWTVCMHVAGVEATTASVIVELGDAPVAHWLQGSPAFSEAPRRDIGVKDAENARGQAGCTSPATHAR